MTTATRLMNPRPVQRISRSRSLPRVQEELTLAAGELLERCTVQDVQLTADGAALELMTGQLIEDDGPAAGYSYQDNDDFFSGKIWVKKLLVVRRPQATRATLLIAPGGDVQAEINGQRPKLTRCPNEGVYWQAYEFDSRVLKSGINEIIIRGSGGVWIARADEYAAGSLERTSPPGRSAKTHQAGKDWSFKRLGSRKNVQGEYCIRLFLEQYRPAGQLTSPVFDLTNLAGAAIAPAASALGPVAVKADVDGGRVGIEARCGDSYLPDEQWSPWQRLRAMTLRAPAGRFIQLRISMQTADPLKSPRLRRLHVRSEYSPAARWHDGIKLQDADNQPVVRTSVPFTYEPYDHPRLAEFRRCFQLDAIAAQASGEFDLIVRLAKWIAHHPWAYNNDVIYPAWDALDILRPYRDGLPVGGYCQQRNMLLIQACESFGLPARDVSMSQGNLSVAHAGHEACEIWCNEYRKWVYVDASIWWYFLDRRSGVPLSLKQLRDRRVQALRGERPAAVKPVIFKKKLAWKGFKGHPLWLELRLIPRSNFLQQKAPLPLNQGMRGWFWTGHHVWHDRAMPTSRLYDKRLVREGDWNWTLNHAHIALEAMAADGELRVHLDTQTPGFDTFLAAVDDQDLESTAAPFIWKLNPGTNRLRVVPRNSAGRLGIVSSVTLTWPGR